MPHFIKIPAFSVRNAATGERAPADQWWLAGELVYQSDLLGEDARPVLVTVPSGFETDLASIPKFPPFLRTIFVRNGRHRLAAVAHDYLVRLGLKFPRRLADRIFLEAMKLEKVKRWHRYPMYWAVRINTERLILIGRARKMRKIK